MKRSGRISGAKPKGGRGCMVILVDVGISEPLS